MECMDFSSVKWLWLYAGAALMLMEILAPGFVIFFFGLAAATVGLVLFVTDLSATMQMVLFTVFSIVYLCGLRRLVKNVFMGETVKTELIGSEYVGRYGEVVEKITAACPGRILVGDAQWTAVANTDIEPGKKVKVIAQQNLTFTVEPVD